MIVGTNEISGVLDTLASRPALSLDTETTGLRPYHGHRPFSIIISDEIDDYYFNLKDYEIDPIPNLSPLVHMLRDFLSEYEGLWFLQNAKFDMHHLHVMGLHFNPNATIHDTKAIARLVDSSLPSYSLDSLGERYLGGRKDDRVKEYIEKNKLFTMVSVDGKKQAVKELHFDRVPTSLIVPYALKDARLTYDLGMLQRQMIEVYDEGLPDNYPSMWPVYRNECRLTWTVWKMEVRGVKLDRGYCERAIAYESGRMDEAASEFERITGMAFKDSRKLFSDVFQGEKLCYTAKSNATFSSDVLARFGHPAASVVLRYRDAKSRRNFFANFLYQSDGDGIVRASFAQDGTATGRFSSSSPNLQNLTKENVEASLFPVRRAIVPRGTNLFFMLDYDQVEYRVFLEYAKPMDLIAAVNGGLDVHAATALAAGISRDAAKTTNFTMLYGGGVGLIAERLKLTRHEATDLMADIMGSAPEIGRMMARVKHRAAQRGYVINWFGRQIKCQDMNHASVNYLIQSGCADVIKIAMNTIDDMLEFYNTKLVMTIHDELVIECPPEEVHLIPEIRRLMATAFPAKYLPLTVGIDHSTRSLADKVEGLPVYEKA